MDQQIHIERRWPLWRVRYVYENDAWFWSRRSATRYAHLCANKEVYQWGNNVKILSPGGITTRGPSAGKEARA